VKTMSAYGFISDIERRLSQVSDSPRAEAELVLAHVTGLSRSAIYSETSLDAHLPEVDEVVRRRLSGEPLQYITGLQWFFGMDLKVGPGVLIPRAETEVTVQVALGQISAMTAPIVIDVGTGSGAIAMSIAKEREGATVIAVEKEPAAMRWARRNAHSGNICLVQADLFDGVDDSLRSKVGLVVSNPPYLSSAELASSRVEVRGHEPTSALLADDDGFAIVGRLISESPEWLLGDGSLVIEISPDLEDRTMAAIAERFDTTRVVADLAGRSRVVVGQGRSL